MTNYGLNPSLDMTMPRQPSPYELILLEQAMSQPKPEQQQGTLPSNLIFDSLVGGGSGAGGAAASGGSAAPAAAGSYTLPTELGLNGPTAAAPTMSALLPWLGVAGIAAGTGYTAMNAWKNAKNKGVKGGLKEGIKAAGPLNFVPVLGQAAWAAGALRGAFSGKKHKDQYQRDAVRKSLRGSLLDDAYNITLADGSKFDVGKDGSVRNYDVNMSRAGAGDTIGGANPLAHLIGRGNNKVRSDFSGYFANAAMSSGDTRANLVKMYKDAGLDHDTAYMMIHNDTSLDQPTKDAYKNGLDELFGVGAYAGGRTPVPAAAPNRKPLPAALAPRTNQPLTAPGRTPQYSLTSMRR